MLKILIYIKILILSFIITNQLVLATCQDDIRPLLLKETGPKIDQVIEEGKLKVLMRDFPFLKSELELLDEVEENPHIMMSAMEFGTLNLSGQEITVKVGGQAVVVNDMINNFPLLLKEKKSGKLSFSFMAYEGINKGTYVKSIQVKMNQTEETIKIYKHTLANQVEIYFLDHPIFKRRNIKNPYVNKIQDGILYSGKDEWEDFYSFTLFNKANAKLFKEIKANIYHAHDVHTSMSAFYIDKKYPKTLTIHNAGAAYQGGVWTKGYGEMNFKRAIHPDYPYGVPTGDYQQNDELLNMMGLTFDEYMRYFEYDGGLITYKGILKYLNEYDLISGVPVSQGYAQNMGDYTRKKMIDDQMVERILTEENVINGLDGIENGLDYKFHASRHQYLKKKSLDELASIHSAIRDEDVRREWLEELNFGQDLISKAGIRHVHKQKARLKEMLQKTSGLEIHPDKPLFTVMGRLVDQKNIQVFAENIKYIISQGGQVVIAGQATKGDQVGESLEILLKQLEKDPHLKGQYKFYNEFVNKELGALIQAGGDFFVIPSKFEPCGLTDIEAVWLGNIPIARRIGGLGKVKNAYYYDWDNPKEVAGEVNALRKLLGKVMGDYQYQREKIDHMRIEGMKEDFTWEKALAKYVNNYHLSALHKVMNQIDRNLKNGTLTINSVKKILNKMTEALPKNLLENYNRMTKKLNDKSFSQNYLLALLPGKSD